MMHGNSNIKIRTSYCSAGSLVTVLTALFRILKGQDGRRLLNITKSTFLNLQTV